MKKYIDFMLFVIMMSVTGCKPNTCDKTNDDCVEKPTASCAPNDGVTYKSCGKCKCIFVDPLKITLGTLIDAKVGEEYKGKDGEITATGGIQPYSWSLLIDPVDSDKLDWLTIDPNTGVLSSKPDKFPSTPFPDGIKFKVVLNDSSVKGKDYRPDNKGVTEEVMLKITDCERNKCLGSDLNINQSECDNISGKVKDCRADPYGCARLEETDITSPSICNGHATACSFSDGNMICTCSVAYTGNKCDLCAVGALGIFPYCFQASADYCLTSQCVPVTPTGQNQCYDDIGNDQNPCPGTGSNPPNCDDGKGGVIDYCGQDAQYLDRIRTFKCTGGPCASNASVNNEVVTDSLTKLIWQRYVIDTSTKYKWEDTTVNPTTHPAGGY